MMWVVVVGESRSRVSSNVEVVVEVVEISVVEVGVEWFLFLLLLRYLSWCWG